MCDVLFSSYSLGDDSCPYTTDPIVKIFMVSVSTRVAGARPAYQKFLRDRGVKIRELVSYLDGMKEWARVTEMKDTRFELMLDSGAYTAWTQNATIDLDAYAAFIREHADDLDVVVNLDVLPGRWGHMPSSSEIEKSAEAGWENWQTLTKKVPDRLRPMHVFHQGENWSWLTRLMDHAEYFGVSPGNDRTPPEKRAWLDDVFRRVTDNAGRPLRKTHGFGITSLDAVTRFPFWSLDSLTWLFAGRYGHVCIPIAGILAQIAVSELGTEAHNGRHIRAFSPPEYAMVKRHVEDRGFTLEKLATTPSERDLFNILAFTDLESCGTATFRPAASQQEII